MKKYVFAMIGAVGGLTATTIAIAIGSTSSTGEGGGVDLNEVVRSSGFALDASTVIRSDVLDGTTYLVARPSETAQPSELVDRNDVLCFAVINNTKRYSGMMCTPEEAMEEIPPMLVEDSKTTRTVWGLAPDAITQVAFGERTTTLGASRAFRVQSPLKGGTTVSFLGESGQHFEYSLAPPK